MYNYMYQYSKKEQNPRYLSVQLDPKWTKLQIARALAVASSVLADRVESEAEYFAKHYGKDDLLKEVKRHNLSYDFEGNKYDPYRFNKVVNSYVGRVCERLNLPEWMGQSLNALMGNVFYDEFRGMLTEEEIPLAIAKAKREFRKYLPDLLAKRTEENESCLKYRRMYSKCDFLKHQLERDEEFQKLTALQAMLWQRGLSELYDEQDALNKKITERLRILQDEAKASYAAHSMGEVVYYAYREEFGLPTACEKTIEERNALQRAVAAGILHRKDGYFKRA